jgi:hypothetical protein
VHTWPEFSNHTPGDGGTSNSLEAIHDGIHVDVGGRGHMSNTAVAGNALSRHPVSGTPLTQILQDLTRSSSCITQMLTACFPFGQPSILESGLHPVLLKADRGPSLETLPLAPTQVCRIILEQYGSVLTIDSRSHAFLEYAIRVLALVRNHED